MLAVLLPIISNNSGTFSQFFAVSCMHLKEVAVGGWPQYGSLIQAGHSKQSNFILDMNPSSWCPSFLPHYQRWRLHLRPTGDSLYFQNCFIQSFSSMKDPSHILSMDPSPSLCEEDFHFLSALWNHCQKIKFYQVPACKRYLGNPHPLAVLRSGALVALNYSNSLWKAFSIPEHVNVIRGIS